MMQGRVGTSSKRVLTLNKSTVLPSVFTDLFQPPPPPSFSVLAGLMSLFLTSLTFGVLDRMDGGEKGPDPPPG